jgi:hypothetical protein
MHCRACNFDLKGLTSNACPECGRTFDPGDPESFAVRPRSWFGRNLGRILLAFGSLFLIAVISSGFLVYRAMRVAMEAEERLQATRVVAVLIADYVEKSPTHSWPTSWADLEKLPSDGCMFRWPSESAKYKAIVKIDFTATPASVLKQTPATCTAVTVAPGPSFQGFPAMELEPLFTRLQELRTHGGIVDPGPSKDERP